MENAKIFAENVIRNRREALNMKRFAAKMDAIGAKLEAAARTQNVSIVSEFLRCQSKLQNPSRC